MNYFNIKKRIIKQYFTDCNIREVIERMEEFAKNKLVLIYDIDEYVQETKNKKREFWVTLAKLVVYIRVYEVFVMGFIDDIRIRLLIMDYTLNSNGNRLLYILAICSVDTLLLVIPSLLQYLEMSRQLPMIKMLHLIKYRIIKYPLNSNHYRKYCFYLKIMSLIFYNSFINIFAIFCTICHTFIFGSYMRNGFEIYSIFGQILGNFTFFFTFYYATAYLVVLSFVWFSCTQYLKFKFEEINTKIELSLKQMNIRLLMNAIHEHNYVERLTRDINYGFCRMNFMIYYFLTLSSQLILYMSQRDDILLINKISFRVLAMGYIISILVINLSCNQISSRAHKSYSILFSISVNENIRMSLKQRLKLMSFMEKLSGPQIGFYCYDLFAMNSNRFYHYICIYVSNYILIASLFP